MNIIINGQAEDFVHELIRYEDVREMAGLKGNPGCTWRSRDGRGGILSAGRTVPVSDGMVFNIIHTGNA